jgi:hypothetical protein
MAESPSITPLRVFLSYSSEQANIAEQVYFSLKTSGHDVFFDRTNLLPGKEYNRAILERIRSSDLFVFLISPSSIQDSAYTRTEMRFARDTWPNPEGHVFPVLAVPTDFSQIPNYLKAVTILRPDGNLPAEVSARVNDLAAGRTLQDTIAGKAELIDQVVKETEQLHRSVYVAEIDKQWDIEQKESFGLKQPHILINTSGDFDSRVKVWFYGLIVMLIICFLPIIVSVLFLIFLFFTQPDFPNSFWSLILLVLGFVIFTLVMVYASCKKYTALRMKAREYKEAERRYHSRRMDARSGKYDNSPVFPKETGTIDDAMRPQTQQGGF